MPHTITTTPALLLAFSVVTFLWTNWYFSPERRLQRLADRIDRSWSRPALDAHAAIWSTELKPSSASSLDPSAHCRIDTCSITFSSLFSVHRSPIRYFTISIEVLLVPIPTSMNDSRFLPVSIMWHPERFRWTVYFAETEGAAKIIASHGDIADLTTVPRPGGSEAIAKFIAVVSQQIRSRLTDQ